MEKEKFFFHGARGPIKSYDACHEVRAESYRREARKVRHRSAINVRWTRWSLISDRKKPDSYLIIVRRRSESEAKETFLPNSAHPRTREKRSLQAQFSNFSFIKAKKNLISGSSIIKQQRGVYLILIKA
jgi:hypothetical protein